MNLRGILMKTLIQDVTAIEMVKDRTGKASLSLFLFSDIERILECHKLVDFSGLKRDTLHPILQLIQQTL